MAGGNAEDGGGEGEEGGCEMIIELAGMVFTGCLFWRAGIV